MNQDLYLRYQLLWPKLALKLRYVYECMYACSALLVMQAFNFSISFLGNGTEIIVELLLVKLLKDHGGAVHLAYFKDKIEMNQMESGFTTTTTTWCKCGLCREMQNPVERVCCKRQPCV